MVWEFVMQSYLVHMISNVFTPKKNDVSHEPKWKTKTIFERFFDSKNLPDWSDRDWSKDGELPLQRPFQNKYHQ